MSGLQVMVMVHNYRNNDWVVTLEPTANGIPIYIHNTCIMSRRNRFASASIRARKGAFSASLTSHWHELRC